MLWGLGVSTGIAILAAATVPWTLRLFTRGIEIIAAATTMLWITVLLEPGAHLQRHHQRAARHRRRALFGCRRRRVDAVRDVRRLVAA